MEKVSFLLVMGIPVALVAYIGYLTFKTPTDQKNQRD